jgi:hypothetical protein
VPLQSESSKNALVMFRKALFRVENAKKYFQTNKYNEARKNKSSLEVPEEFKQEFPESEQKTFQEKEWRKKYLLRLEKKSQEEQEENMADLKKLEGQMIVYGQHIQLRHIYSYCLVTFKGHSLARENGCFEVALKFYF